MENLTITSEQLDEVRALNDFDLKMLLSEVNDHGWEVASNLLPLMHLATDAHGDRREEEVH